MEKRGELALSVPFHCPLREGSRCGQVTGQKDIVFVHRRLVNYSRPMP